MTCIFRYSTGTKYVDGDGATNTKKTSQPFQAAFIDHRAIHIRGGAVHALCALCASQSDIMSAGKLGEPIKLHQ